MIFKSKYPGLVAYAQKKFKDVGVIIGVYTLELLWVNPHIAKQLGYSRKEMENMKLGQVMHVDSASVSAMFMGFFLKRGRKVIIAKGKKGERVRGEGTATPFMYEGEPYIAGCKAVFSPWKVDLNI